MYAINFTKLILILIWTDKLNALQVKHCKCKPTTCQQAIYY